MTPTLPGAGNRLQVSRAEDAVLIQVIGLGNMFLAPTLQALVEKSNVSDITVDTLIDAGLISKNDLVKILGNGTLSATVNVTAHAFSKSAVAAIEANKGKATKL